MTKSPLEKPANGDTRNYKSKDDYDYFNGTEWVEVRPDTLEKLIVEYGEEFGTNKGTEYISKAFHSGISYRNKEVEEMVEKEFMSEDEHECSEYEACSCVEVNNSVLSRIKEKLQAISNDK